jgi:putative transposase
MMCRTTRTTESSMKTLNPAVARVLKRLHYPLDVILTCVRWYVAYPLSLRHLEDMIAYSTQREQPFQGKVNRDSTAK